MHLHNKIPSIIGVVILVIGLAAGVFLIGQRQVFRLGAVGSTSPQDVRVSNITDSSFTVSWFTEQDAVGLISWGQTTSLGQLARQLDSSPTRIHSVTVTGLNPGATHYFVINSGGSEFDNDGVPWSVTTGPALAAPTSTLLASGTVFGSDGAPAGMVLVYINGGSLSQLSTLSSPNGTWTIPLSAARSKTLSSYTVFEDSTVLDIFVQGGSQSAAAQANALSANPTPNITLGQTYDFRNETTGGVNLPEADVNLPGDTGEQPSGEGALDISGEPTETGDVVTLESIEESGEVVYTTTPEFFGEGPAGELITITIESDPITDTVRVGGNGSWSFSPETALAEGEHTITIKWTDAQGILRSLTRTFTVLAAEGEPGFESTPSAQTPTPAPTASPTPTPSPTPSPTATPNPTASATPSPTPVPTLTPTPTPTRVSIPSTESGVPAAGNLTPTLLLATIGLALFLSGIVISRKNI